MNDSGFRMIVDKVLDGLGCSSRINQENIRKHVSVVAKKIKDDLRNELKHRLVSLKIDCVTRLGRAIIGINLQFVRDGRIHLRTLAMTEIDKRHTGEHFCTMVLDTLHLYGLKLEGVYSITTDGGSNLLKCVKLLIYQREREAENKLESAAIDEMQITMPDEDSDDAENACDEEINELDHGNSEEIDVCQEEERDHLDGEETREIPIAEHELVEEQPNIESDQLASLEEVPIGTLVGVRCVAHLLQNAVNGAINATQSAKTTISTARELAKRLRKQNLRMVIKAAGVKCPVLDVETRWHSTCDMLLSLLEIKDFCEEQAKNFPKEKLALSTHQWEAMENITAALMPAKVNGSFSEYINRL